MKISLTKEECVAFVIKQLETTLPEFDVKTDEEWINAYGKTDFELIKKEPKND